VPGREHAVCPARAERRIRWRVEVAKVLPVDQSNGAHDGPDGVELPPSSSHAGLERKPRRRDHGGRNVRR
jgi:hypothetical protein